MKKIKIDESKIGTVVLHTPCLEAGMYPRCAKVKDKCELKEYAKQVWDKDHIIERCETPSLVVEGNRLTSDFCVPIRPLRILGVAEPTMFKANQGSRLHADTWTECPRYKIQITGCSRFFECSECISESKQVRKTSNSINTKKTTRMHLHAPMRMDIHQPQRVGKETTGKIQTNPENDTEKEE